MGGNGAENSGVVLDPACFAMPVRKPSELGDELNLIPHHREATLHKTSFYLYTPVSHD